MRYALTTPSGRRIVQTLCVGCAFKSPLAFAVLHNFSEFDQSDLKRALLWQLQECVRKYFILKHNKVKVFGIGSLK
jgi:hypothetical protein